MAKFFYNLHGLLKIRSDINLNFNYFRHEKLNYNLDIRLVKDFNVNKKNLKKLGLFYYGLENNDSIYFESRFSGFRPRVFLKNLSGKTTLLINKAFYLTRLPINFHNFIKIILQMKLSIMGYSLLHSACLEYNGEGILISALADTGKSTTVLNCLRKKSFSYLSDDLIIIDKERIAYCMPRLINFRTLKKTGYFDNKSIKKKFSFGKFKTLLSEIPYLSAYFGPIDTLDIHKALDLPIKQETKISKIFIIENGEETCNKIEKSLAFHKIKTINKEELGTLPVLLYMYTYLNSHTDLNKIKNRDDYLIEKIVESSDCYAISCKNPNKYSEFIFKILEK